MTCRSPLLPLLAIVSAAALTGQSSKELRFCLRGEPKTFDPLLVEDSNSETIRYLTGGVLIRVNRSTQQLTPELAISWKVDGEGRGIAFHLRRNVVFSDGTPFSAEDVAYTMNRLMDRKLRSPTADPFRSSDRPPTITTDGPDKVTILFAAPVSGLERLFDQVAILSAHSTQKSGAVLGPYYVGDYKTGVEVVLKRNPNYWKFDGQGRRLPYMDSVRLQIQQNREIELVRFRRGELDLINSLDSEMFEQLERQAPSSVHDAGASLESEMMWFNQVPTAPLPPYKKAWFASTQFRRALSEAINRQDICQVIYRGHARPAEGPVSPANRFWFNGALKPHPHDVVSALHRLEGEGFRVRDGVLYDRDGHIVEFSIMTNAGNRTRERIAAMIQQDLRTVGIRLNVVTLDFPSLIERMTQTFNYEACLLSLTNVDLDPSGQMNVWLSSASNHQWNPNQKMPATAWEAEIDRLMRAQAAEPRTVIRKHLFDQVQRIVSEEAPFLYLVNANSLMAFSPQVQNAMPAAVQPQAYWNIETLWKSTQTARNR